MREPSKKQLLEKIKLNLDGVRSFARNFERYAQNPNERVVGTSPEEQDAREFHRLQKGRRQKRESFDLDEKFLGFGKPKGPGPSLASYYVLGHAHPEGLNFSAGTKGVVKSGSRIKKTHNKIHKMMGNSDYKQSNAKLRTFSLFLASKNHSPQSAYEMGQRHNRLGEHERDHDEMSDETNRDLHALSHNYNHIPGLASAYGRQARRTA